MSDCMHLLASQHSSTRFSTRKSVHGRAQVPAAIAQQHLADVRYCAVETHRGAPGVLLCFVLWRAVRLSVLFVIYGSLNTSNGYS